jgi:hypothetical protein
MNTLIQRLNGAIYNLEDYGITTRDFVVSSPVSRPSGEVIEGRHGVVGLGLVYDVRKINASFYLKAVDYDDYALLRDEVFRVLRTDEAFYVTESRNPGKRWLVKIESPFTIEQQGLYGFFDVEFIADNPFAESIGTTLDPLTFDTELWQIGQGIIDDGLTYSHTTSTFRIYNIGDTAVNPRQHPLVITFKGASTNLKIKNVTTGEEWAYTGATTASDTMKLDGIRSTKNGLSIFRDTNRKVISLVPGWNDFVITGAIGAVAVSFDFRFYYL